MEKKKTFVFNGYTGQGLNYFKALTLANSLEAENSRFVDVRLIQKPKGKFGLAGYIK